MAWTMIPAGEAFHALVSVYKNSERYADTEVCRRVAEEVLIDRLRCKQLKFQATHLHSETLIPDGFDEREMADVVRPETHFWELFASAKKTQRNADWECGDFKFKLRSSPFEWAGHAFGVSFDLDTLPEIIKSHLSNRSKSISSSTNVGERECAGWLQKAFDEDLAKQRSKDSFRTEALKQFRGRLSLRGFNRVWDSIAPQAGRSKAGRKS